METNKELTLFQKIGEVQQAKGLLKESLKVVTSLLKEIE